MGKENVRVKKLVFYSLSVLLCCLLLYRALVIYFTDTFIYHWAGNLPVYFDGVGFLVALMDIGFASGAAIVIKQVRLQLKAKEKERNLVNEKLETELKFLRSQTNPHFLFNTLNSIYALARKRSVETPEAVMKLSKLLRFMLYETKKSSINIGDEIKMLEDYIELEKLRYNGKLDLRFCRDIDNENEQISPLLLMPFVENAFKHGAGENRFQTFIAIDMKLNNGILYFNIENTSETKDKSVADENIGLSSVRRQLELMYSDYDLKTQNNDSVFKVSLRINFKSRAKI
jgi:LytS/YehU family sensor histidine kinase